MNGFERRKEQKKRKILETALTLFMKYNIRKVSVSEIAKEAQVSQVTIYNYFENKDNLVHEVIIFYVDKIWEEYEQLFNSNIPFPTKVKKIIFDKSEVASHINEEFFEYFMKEYSGEDSYIEKLYMEKALPRFMELFNEGKEQGFVDPSISNEAILLYLQMFKEFLQRGDVTKNILPITEDLTKLFFFGIAGKNEE